MGTLLMGTSLIKGFGGPPPNPKVPEDADYHMTVVSTLDFSATAVTVADYSSTTVVTGDFQAT